MVETSSSSSFIPSELTKAGNAKVKIIAKLERPLALENLEEIIEESVQSGRVARGDLGLGIGS